MQTIKCGVPQGSILGPLFFILYINDLLNASEQVGLLFFADDASIFYSHSNPNTLESVLNNDLKNIEVWLRCNKLSVNVKKTTYLFFKPWQKKCNYCSFHSTLVVNFLLKPTRLNFLEYILTSTLLGKISVIYVNKFLNQLGCYSGPVSIYLQKLNSLCTTR